MTKQRMRRSPMIGCMAAALIAGCGADPPLAEITVHGPLSDPRDMTGLTLVVGSHELTASDFDESGQLRMTFPESGELEVELRLEEAGGLIAEGAGTLTMHPDREWYLDVSRGAESHPPCVPCMAPWAFRWPRWRRTRRGQLWFSAVSFPWDDEGVVY